MADTSRDDRAIELHRELRGKVRAAAKAELTPESLELLYTPGVAAVSRELVDNPAAARELTGVGNSVAVISDGSAVLGLGDEGPVPALPVLEGKALLFRALAEIDAVPIALDVPDEDAFVAAVRGIAPGFGAINLEDIAAPACFSIERRLREELDIPVVHDDQHMTAIVVLAALRNACQVTGRKLEDTSVVVFGAGAGGAATARLLRASGVERLAVADSKGPLGPERDDLDAVKRELVEEFELDASPDANPLDGADAVIGLAVPGAFDAEGVTAMADDPIVFALANPDPEVDPAEASEAGAAVVATGRSDFPNQVNNVLVFPGLFRGALDAELSDVEDDAALRAAAALADLIEDPHPERILPDVLDDRVVPAVARAVAGN
ncbi:MAG TPA: malic enzyme-like NAD(P)-binding protein [Thermoleophilaceae bacterium]